MQSSVRRALLAAGTLAILAALTPPPASAAAFCSVDQVIAISPGLSLTPTAATYTTGEKPGKASCTGDVSGKAITGPGTLTNNGQFDAGATCATGRGSAIATFTLPTADGPVVLRNPFTFSYVGILAPFSGPVASGAATFLPIKGNCITAPVTQARVLGFAQLTA